MLGEGVEAEEDVRQLGRKLGRLAAEGGAMPLVEMDGFVAGLVILPAAVSAAEWLPEVWGPENVFDTIEEAEAMVAALLGHYNAVARTLEEDTGEYLPLLELDERTGTDVVWKPWIIGFTRAIRMRPAAWEKIESSNELDVQESLLVIEKLFDAANGTSELEPKGLDLLDNLAPMMIGGAVRDFNAVRRTGNGDAPERHMPSVKHVSVAQAARESLCGCGSGRLYTRCCGSH